MRESIRKILILLIIFSFIFFITFCQNKDNENKTTTNDKVEDVNNNNDDDENVVVSGINNDKTTSLDLEPIMNKNGEKHKISIVISGEYYLFTNIFEGILSAMMKNEWIENLDLPDISKDSQEQIKVLMDFLNSNELGEYVEFPQDLFYNFDWDAEKAKTPEFKELINRDDISIIIGFGTTAGKVLSKIKSDTPVLIASSSDPVSAGIIASVEDSGKDSLTAFCDPDRFYRQIKLFYSVVKFKRLGILYTDTENGKIYAALKDIQRAAKEEGFEIVSNTNLIESDSDPNAPKQYLKALEELLSVKPKVDAVYFTIQAGFTLSNLNNIMEIINKNKVPTFAMEGSEFVKNGVLYSISAFEEDAMGEFNANNVMRILKGDSPRSLNQIFSVEPSISINLDAAKAIDYDVPHDILGSSDEVYPMNN